MMGKFIIFRGHNSKKEFDFILCSGYQKCFPQKLCNGHIFL